MTSAHGEDAGRPALLLSAFAFLCGLVLLVPWEPFSLPADGGDGMFHPLAHHQFAVGAPWGAASLHTSGPWGFVHFPFYLPETYGLLLVVNGIVAAGVAVVLGGMGARFRSRIAAWLLIPLGIWLLALSDDGRWLFVLLSCLAFVPDFARRRSTATFAFLLLLAAFLCTVKGTFLLAGAAVAGIVGALELRARRWPLHLAAFIAAVLGSWWAAVGSLAGLGEHLRHVFESVAAYPEAFSLPAEVWRIAAFAILAWGLLGVVFACERQERGPVDGALAWLGTFFLVWLLYKGAFTRADALHVSRSVLLLMVFGLFFVLSRWEALSRGALGQRAAGPAGPPLLAALFLLAGGVCIAGYQPAHRQLARLDGKLGGLAAVLADGRGPLQQSYERSLGEIRSRFPLPASVSGPVAVFGTLHTPILAAGATYAPMPVVAHYEIWSPRTVARTNDFLAGDAAPEWLLSTGTNLSASNAIEIARRYEPFAEMERATLLRRRPEALPVERETVLERDLRFGEALPIPPGLGDGILVARIEASATWRARVVSLVYQPPRLMLELMRDDGQIAEIRVNRLIAHDGIVLDANPGTWDGRSPNVHLRRHGVLGESAQSPVRAIRLVGGLTADGNPRPYFGDRAHVRIDRVRFRAPTP